MQALKAFFRDHRSITLFVLSAVFALRLIVPVGFMPVVDGGRLIVSICSGGGPAKMAMDMPGMEHSPTKPVADGSCAFADLSMPTLGSIDPIQLAALITLIMAGWLVITAAVPPPAYARLRPPPRGPPAQA